VSLSWKAKRKGDVYCAPACGRGCTYEEYMRAKTEATMVARELGPHWRPYVWENQNWYWDVRSGDFRATRRGLWHWHVQLEHDEPVIAPTVYAGVFLLVQQLRVQKRQLTRDLKRATLLLRTTHDI